MKKLKKAVLGGFDWTDPQKQFAQNMFQQNRPLQSPSGEGIKILPENQNNVDPIQALGIPQMFNNTNPGFQSSWTPNNKTSQNQPHPQFQRGIDFGHIFASQALQGIGQAFANNGANSYQNAVQNFGQQFDGSDYLPYNPNTSKQNLYGNFGDGGSIVDYLDSKGEDFSFSHRKDIAKQLGISDYKGTEDQNLKMLALLNNPSTGKRFVMPGKQDIYYQDGVDTPSTTVSKTTQKTKANTTSGYENVGSPLSFSNTTPSKNIPTKQTSSKNTFPDKSIVTIDKKEELPAFLKFENLSTYKPNTKEHSPVEIAILEAAKRNNGKFNVTDKGTKKIYSGTVSSDGQIHYLTNDPVLTGKNDVPSESNQFKDYYTPVGSADFRNRHDIYGAIGMMLGPTPTAQHIVYSGHGEGPHRYAALNSPETTDNNQSMGCTNEAECTRKKIMDNFNVGDSAYTVDTRLKTPIINQMNQRIFEEGGTYSVTDEQLKQLKKLGYKFNTLK